MKHISYNTISRQYRIFPFYLLFFITQAFSFSACRKFVEVNDIPTQIVSSNVFSNNQSAIATINGIYSQMMATGDFICGGPSSITSLCGMSADELVTLSTTPDYLQFYKNALNASNSYVLNNLWGEGYQYIYDANAILEGIAKSESLSIGTKNELEGQAKFIRALCHFYLLQLFGNIPLVLTTDYHTNNTISQTPAADVYLQIIKDLKDAELLLSSDYSFSGGERIAPNKYAATALLARVYLFQKDWANAISSATTVIETSGIYTLSSNLDEVFLKNSSEAIWQMQPVLPGLNTNEGSTFIIVDNPVNPFLSDQLLNAFEPEDNRKTRWVGSIQTGTGIYYFPFKYKVQASATLTEYCMVLRLAEQYLIRAECRTELNEIPEAQSDLNSIRNRAGLPNTTANDQASLLLAVAHERDSPLRCCSWPH
jgi:hypothetical protein